MKEKITGFWIEFTSREFWLPDAMKDENYIYPMYGFVIIAGKWYKLTEAGVIDQADYAEFERQYNTKTDMEWLGIK